MRCGTFQVHEPFLTTKKQLQATVLWLGVRVYMLTIVRIHAHRLKGSPRTCTSPLNNHMKVSSTHAHEPFNTHTYAQKRIGGRLHTRTCTCTRKRTHARTHALRQTWKNTRTHKDSHILTHSLTHSLTHLAQMLSIFQPRRPQTNCTTQSLNIYHPK
jgi:hypothetical protein